MKQQSQAGSLDRLLRQALQAFQAWCEVKGVSFLPATPPVVAMFVLDHRRLGIDALSVALTDIERAHDARMLSNPVATSVVREALGSLDIDAPRSWSKAERGYFAMLPADVQMVLRRLESSRDKAVRKAQTELATAKQELKQKTEKEVEKNV